MKRHIVPIVAWVALALSGHSLQASYFFAPDVPAELGGTTYLPWNVVEGEVGIYSLEVALAAGTPVDGLHRMESGDWLLSFATPAELGGVTYDPRDVVRFDGVATFTLFFDGVGAGIPEGSNVDALFLDGGDAGDLVLSFDVPTKIGAAVYLPSDLVRFSGGSFSLYFDASATTPAVPISTNVTGADRRGGRLFLSFDVPTLLGAVTFLPGQVVSWDGSTFVSFEADPGWPPGSRLNALAIGCLDGDGDGYGDPGGTACPAGARNDCDDANGAVWGTPGEVTGVVFTDGVTLAWTAPADAGGLPSALVYDTIRSMDPGDFVTVPAALCVESDDGADAMAVDLDVPPPGSAFYYLIRAENACPGGLGVGTLGFTSGGTSRAALPCP